MLCKSDKPSIIIIIIRGAGVYLLVSGREILGTGAPKKSQKKSSPPAGHPVAFIPRNGWPTFLYSPILFYSPISL